MESYTTKDPRILPEPPRLHWGIVLALQIVTLGMFQWIWLVVQANWVRKMTGRRRALIWSLVPLGSVLAAISFATVFTLGMTATGHSEDIRSYTTGFDAGFRLVFVIICFAAIFTLRSELEAYPIGISLGGIMTFFFQTIYFQYHLHDYVLPDASDVYGALPQAPAYVPPTSPEPTL